jgi:hypothetical protein
MKSTQLGLLENARSVCLLLLTFPGAAAAQLSSSRPASPTPFAAPWQAVFTNPDLSVGLDTSRVERVDSVTYRVWMQTRWAAARFGSQKRTASPFNRELIRTYLRCNPTAYRVVGTVVSLDDGPAVDSIVVGDDAARARAWSVAEPQSADAGAGDRACAILRGRSRTP